MSHGSCEADAEQRPDHLQPRRNLRGDQAKALHVPEQNLFFGSTSFSVLPVSSVMYVVMLFLYRMGFRQGSQASVPTFANIILIPSSRPHRDPLNGGS